jgi:hypothetical protein
MHHRFWLPALPIRVGWRVIEPVIDLLSVDGIKECSRGFFQRQFPQLDLCIL